MGNVVLGPSNTAGTIVVRGVGTVEDTTGPGCLVINTMTSPESVAMAFLDATAYMKRDNINYDGNGFPLNGRERLFPTRQLATDATYGGTGEGETNTYIITASPDGTFPNAPRTFDKVRDV
jgi:hypothetical protein